jgi:hypothetical protein
MVRRPQGARYPTVKISLKITSKLNLFCESQKTSVKKWKKDRAIDKPGGTTVSFDMWLIPHRVETKSRVETKLTELLCR